MNGYWVINVADFQRTDQSKDLRRNGRRADASVMPHHENAVRL
jgi:hypothetical protein